MNALTIDVEDWFHPEWVRPHVDDHLSERRALKAVLPVLRLLDRYRVKATFFILGDVAKECPDLVRKIFKEGHEIARREGVSPLGEECPSPPWGSEGLGSLHS